MISYSELIQKLDENGLTRTALAKELHISSRTMAKIGRGERVAPGVLRRIAGYFGCHESALCNEEAANPLLRTLREEKAVRLSGGLYHELQVRMTYNSNHIEGSRLSEDQTRLIFETNTIDAGDGIPVDDIVETVNHFRAVDCVIDRAEEPLTEELIKELHRILKQSTMDSRLDWFAVGDYKKRPNTVGGHETAQPAEVGSRMRALIRSYEAKPQPGFEDIVAFHYEFERIHPFQDGNGRVGRLIALKECLRFSITPFIIEDRKKAFYYRGLAEWERERGFLLETCRDGQDTFGRIMKVFEM